MNERIKELLNQATQYADSLGPIDGAEWCDAEYSKFAELIVKECIEVSEQSQWLEAKGEYYEGFNEAMIYVANKIKEHFGVEE